MTFCHSFFEDVIPLKGINLQATVVCCLGLHICAYFYWLHVENMAASFWLKCKVTRYWLMQQCGIERILLIERQAELSWAKLSWS